MTESLIAILEDLGFEFIYGSRRRVHEFKSSTIHFELLEDEKVAYEHAFAVSTTGKRSCFLTDQVGILYALDPLMSSAYMGIRGSMLIIVLKDGEADLSFLGPFSKVPFIIESSAKHLYAALQFSSLLSEKYEIPVLLELNLFPFWSYTPNLQRPISVERRKAQFEKDLSRWAATPSLRYALHKRLNEKLERIEEEFYGYERNVLKIKSEIGFISPYASDLIEIGDDHSTLLLSTVHPVPQSLVSEFMEKMDEVYLFSERDSAIDSQILRFREKLRYVRERYPKRENLKKEEEMLGYLVVRDTLGPSSSMNMAHGIKKCDPKKKVLAITYEDHFFHSGMQAFINTLYNDSKYHLLVCVKNREKDLISFMEGLHFEDYAVIEHLKEVENFREEDRFMVFIYRGYV